MGLNEVDMTGWLGCTCSSDVVKYTTTVGRGETERRENNMLNITLCDLPNLSKF